MNEISYLKGLLDGMGIDPASPEGKIYGAMCSAMEALAKQNAELSDRVAELEELCEILDEDLGDLEDFLCEDDEDDDFDCDGCMADDFDEEEYETVCPTCGNCILLDERTLEEGETVCPNCGEELVFDFDEDDIEALTGDTDEE